MTTVLKHKITLDGISLSCFAGDRQLPVDSWGKESMSLDNGENASVGAVNLLIEQEQASITEYELSVFLPHSVLCRP